MPTVSSPARAMRSASAAGTQMRSIRSVGSSLGSATLVT